MWVKTLEGHVLNLQEIPMLKLEKLGLDEWVIVAITGFREDSPWYQLSRSRSFDKLVSEMLDFRQMSNIDLGFPAYTLH